MTMTSLLRNDDIPRYRSAHTEHHIAAKPNIQPFAARIPPRSLSFVAATIHEPGLECHPLIVLLDRNRKICLTIPPQ